MGCRLGMVVVVVSALAGHADAQTTDSNGTYVADPALAGDLEPVYVPALRDPPRLEIGFDVGLGELGGFCDGCPEQLAGLSIDVHIGMQPWRRVALGADLWTIGHLLPPDDHIGLVAQTFMTVAAQVWITPVVWLKSGVGAGVLSVIQSGGIEDEISIGPGATLAVGGEVRHRPTSGIDVSLRLGAGAYPGDGDETVVLFNISAGLGWHWN